MINFASTLTQCETVCSMEIFSGVHLWMKYIPCIEFMQTISKYSVSSNFPLLKTRSGGILQCRRLYREELFFSIKTDYICLHVYNRCESKQAPTTLAVITNGQTNNPRRAAQRLYTNILWYTIYMYIWACFQTGNTKNWKNPTHNTNVSQMCLLFSRHCIWIGACNDTSRQCATILPCQMYIMQICLLCIFFVLGISLVFCLFQAHQSTPLA